MQGKQCIASISIQRDPVQDRIVNQKIYKNYFFFYSWDSVDVQGFLQSTGVFK
jgi:hypothetical protein